jgi:hypothetical protein
MYATVQQRFGTWCRGFDMSKLYHTKVGIKCTNQLLSSDMFMHFARGAGTHIPTSDLFIGYDALVDSVTLLKTPLERSPHVELMELLGDNRAVRESEYVRRAGAGTLDARIAHRISARFLCDLKTRFERASEAFANDAVAPIPIFTIDGVHYIADGKHRAAMYVLRGNRPLCFDVSTAIFDSFYWWVHRKMKKRPRIYRKHIAWFDAAKRTIGQK